jgi:hypothetical protein
MIQKKVPKKSKQGGGNNAAAMRHRVSLFCFVLQNVD